MAKAKVKAKRKSTKSNGTGKPTAWRSRIVGSGDEKPGDLIANPRNWRLHPKAQQDALAGVLSEVGWVQNIIVNKRTGYVVDGHARVALAISQEEPTVPVVYVDLDENEEGIVLAALDPLAAMAGTDQGKLDALLAEITVSDEALRAMLKEPEGGLTDDDAIPEAPEPTTKLGDLWLLGDHRLLCGDATKAEDVERLMAGAKATLMLADPPYGVSVAGGTHDPRDAKNYRSGGKISNDGLTGQALSAFARQVFEVADSVLASGAAWYVFYAGSETRAMLDAVECLGGMRHVLVWVKPNFVFTRADYHYRHEPIMYGWKSDAAHRWLGDRKQDSVWEQGRSDDLQRKLHPTVKPVGVMARPVENHVEAAGVVYDPFLGSGTTLIACEKLGRRCYGMEIEPRYVDVAVRRWEEYTGEKAVLDG